MKVPRGPGIRYTITNNKVSFSISRKTDNTSKTLTLSNMIIPSSQVVKDKLHSDWTMVNLIGQWLKN